MTPITRVTRQPPDTSSVEHFQLITLHIAGAEIDARPYEFVEDTATKFASVCPHCAQGIFIDATEIKEDGTVICPECKAGQEQQIPDMQDPFVNPINHSVSAVSLDPDITDVRRVDIKDDGLSALDRINSLQ